MADIVQRHQFADYLNVSATSTAEWVLMGTGFTKIDEEPGAQTDTKKYVNEASASTSISRYETKFPFDTDLIPDQDAIAELYQIARDHGVGAEAEREYVRVELWSPGTAANTFAARKFTVAVEVTSISGENAQTISGTLHGVGDPVNGTFNTSTKAFTAAT